MDEHLFRFTFYFIVLNLYR